jgi:hypothetical protein
MGKGGGGGGAPTQATSYQTNVPEYAKPYVTNMLEATQQQLFNMDGGGISGFKPYQPYSSDVNNYVAGFSPMQQSAQRGIAGLQTPGQFADASNMTQQAGLASLNAQYNPMGAGYNQVRGAQTRAAQMGNAPMSQAAMGSAQDMQAATGSAQDMQAAQMGGSPQAQAAAMQAAQLSNTPLAQASQFGGPQNVSAQNVGTQDYTGQNVSNYMNPYLKGALDPQLAEVQRQYDITGAQQKSGAAKSGAFGGSREALMAAENQRNAGLAKNQIIGQGYNQAFQNAQQQFNTQQQANLQAQQANQGANLQAGLANQNMGYNTGLQNAQLQQQANLANQGLLGQYGLQQGQFGQAANQFNAGNQQQANLANQALAGQYGMQQGQFNQAANQANQAARNQFGMANLSNQQAANQANQQARNQFGIANLGNQQQSNLANQALMGQYGLQQGQFGQAANLANQQSRNQANLANQQAQLQAQQQNIGQQQFGANYRMQGLGQAGQLGGQLAGIGGQQLSAQQGIYGMQNQIGAQQQAQEQTKINQAIQDYATQQQYPMMQLGLMSNMLRGLPMQSTNVQSYQAQAPVAQQAAGLLGAYNAYSGKKAGGVIKDYKKGGVTEGIPGYKSGVLVGLEDDIDNIAQMDAYAPPTQKQLPKLAQQTSSPGLKQMIGTQQAEDAMGQKMAGVAAAPTGDLGMNMATGGIVPRFATGELITAPMYTSADDALTKTQELEDKQLKSLQERLSPEEKAVETRQAERLAGLSAKQRKAERNNEAMAFLKFASTPGGLAAGTIAAGEKYMLGQADIDKTYEEMNDNLVKSAAELKKARRLEAKGNVAGAETKYLKSYELDQTAKGKQAELNNALTKQQMADAAALERTNIDAKSREKIASTSPTLNQSLADRARQSQEFEAKYGRKPTLVELMQETTTATKGYDEAQASRLRTDAQTALNDWEKRQLTEDKTWLKKTEAEKEAARDAQYASIIKRMQKSIAAASAGAGQTTAPTANPLAMDGFVFPDKKSLDAYKAAKAKG